MVFQAPTSDPVVHRFDGVKAVQVANWQVNFAHKFDLKYLYRSMHEMLVDEGWGEKDPNFPEKWYMHKENPTGVGEARIRWRCKKIPEPNYKGLFEWWMDLEFAFFGMKDAEITVNGQKVKVKKGGFELITKAFLVVDKDKAFGKGILKNFKEVFLNKMIKQQYDKSMLDLYKETFAVRDFVMDFAKLKPEWIGAGGGEYYLKRDMS